MTCRNGSIISKSIECIAKNAFALIRPQHLGFSIIVSTSGEGQPKEPHVPRGDSGKDPPPVKQKPRSR